MRHFDKNETSFIFNKAWSIKKLKNEINIQNILIIIAIFYECSLPFSKSFVSLIHSFWHKWNEMNPVLKAEKDSSLKILERQFVVGECKEDEDDDF